jgi:hypothetical protein
MNMKTELCPRSEASFVMSQNVYSRAEAYLDNVDAHKYLLLSLNDSRGSKNRSF